MIDDPIPELYVNESDDQEIILINFKIKFHDLRKDTNGCSAIAPRRSSRRPGWHGKNGDLQGSRQGHGQEVRGLQLLRGTRLQGHGEIHKGTVFKTFKLLVVILKIVKYSFVTRNLILTKYLFEDFRCDFFYR